MKKRIITTVFIIFTFLGILIIINIKSISLYFYLKSIEFKKDTEYISNKTYDFQKWFLRMPSSNDELMAFASINIVEDQEIVSIQRIKKYHIGLIFCDSTYIAVIRSPGSGCDNIDNLNLFNIIRFKRNVLVKVIDVIPFRCFDNKSTILTKDLKLVNSSFPDFIKSVKRISKEVSISGKVTGNHYLTFQANYMKNNWTIKVLCDEKQLTSNFPSIFTDYKNFITNFDHNEIDYMLFTVLIW